LERHEKQFKERSAEVKGNQDALPMYELSAVDRHNSPVEIDRWNNAPFKA